MKLLICGDTKPTSKNQDLFIKNDLKKLVGNELNLLFEQSDLNIFNLECPLTNSNSTIVKEGPHLKANPSCINFFDSNKNLICLANNHIYDYGTEGFHDTLNALIERNITHIGYVDNNKIVSTFQSDKIVVINVCEHEYSYNRKLNEGAFCNDIFYLIKEIQKHKDKYIIIIYHGGKELYPYPTPNLQHLCRNLADFGANLIVCQHSHCLGCFENYKNCTIVYGQGDFLFDSSNPIRKYGMLISLDLEKRDIKFHFYVKQEDGTIKKEDDNEIFNDFIKRSELIKDSKFVKKAFDEYCSIHGPAILNSMLHQNKINSILNHRLINFFFIKHMPKKKIVSMLSKIQCEPHKESVENYLRSKIE